MINITNKRKKGNIGEEIACTFLKNKGFSISERNFQRKWGELDIIAQKDNIIHFFEVKGVTKYLNNWDEHKPEENVDGWKVKHLKRIIETYIDEKYGNCEIEFKFHVLCVYMDMVKRKGRVKWIKDIIL